MRKAILIGYVDHYAIRIKHIEQYFIKNGYSVETVSSWFDHATKERKSIKRDNQILIHCRSYSKNISASRVLSLLDFAFGVRKYLKKHNPDVIYAMLPPNCVAPVVARYAKKQGCKLIFDILDMWPESMPSRILKKIKPMYYGWQSLRDRYLNAADVIFSECKLYMDMLADKSFAAKMRLLYLAKEDVALERRPQLRKDVLSFCYLGSINNIIDAKGIAHLVKELRQYKPVEIHIIGGGENKETFIAGLTQAGAKVKDHGMLYDAAKKQAIFDQCHFGINMMKDMVCVGLTMKSIDYLRAGLPLLNSIKGDTEALVVNKGCGINVNPSLQACVAQIIHTDAAEFINMRENARTAFTSLFKSDVIAAEITSVLSNIV